MSRATVADGRKELRSEIGDLRDRLDRIEGYLDPKPRKTPDLKKLWSI